MQMRFKTLLAAATIALAAATPLAQAAGSVTVRFVDSDRYTDIGRMRADRERALQALQRHFTSLGARLPDGQALTIEVLDVDLAGELDLLRPGAAPRMMTGRSDWPRMTLKYALSAGGQPVRSAQVRLSDPDYLDRRAQGPAARSEPFAHDLAMIDRWFDQTFGKGTAPAR